MELLILSSSVYGLPHGTQDQGRVEKRRKLAFEIPLQRRGTTSGTVGLGDSLDLLYTVPIELGDTVMAVNIDTGSSDLWVVSNACNTDICNNSTATRYPATNFQPAGVGATMNYGDSKTGTSASGPIGTDTASIAGITVSLQPFVSVNSTNNPIVSEGASGILGFGFPDGSVIQSALISQKATIGSDNLLSSIPSDGPLLSRLVMSNQLENPQFAVTLQTSTIDISGNGQLSVGKLPDGVDNSSLTWVPVRLYTPAEGGQNPPSFAPNEVYPSRWEIDIDAVFLDGKQLPNSAIAPQGLPSSNQVSALIDTGNSIIRGPSDVVQNILTTVSPSFNPSSTDEPVIPCNVPHTLSFQIGGKIFPVDPRDFISPSPIAGDTTNCIVDNVVATDPPSMGALFSWNLGDPFFKSNVIAFHYGNLTHPSVDPPRIGLLSTVPSNANSLLETAVQDAVQNGGHFESTLESAPTAGVANLPQSTIVISTEPLAQITASVSSGQTPAKSPSNRKNATSSFKLGSISFLIAVVLPLLFYGL